MYNPGDNFNGINFQQQLANLQNSLAQLGKTYPQAIPPTPAQPADIPDSVSGIEGAHKYLEQMAWNTTRYVWDNQADRFYLLRKDANGKALPIMIGDFTLKQEPSMEDKYVTREDFNALVSRLNELLGQKGPDNNG